MKEAVFDCIFAILLFSLGIVVGITLNNIDFSKSAVSAEISNCSDMDFILTAKCLNDDLRNWFSYNLSNLNKDMNLSELKQKGGVCWQYAKWYKDNFINLGFNAKTFDLSADDTGHTITIAWTKNLSDGNGVYCIADQTKVFCNQDLGVINMTLYEELVGK